MSFVDRTKNRVSGDATVTTANPANPAPRPENEVLGDPRDCVASPAYPQPETAPGYAGYATESGAPPKTQKSRPALPEQLRSRLTRVVGRLVGDAMHEYREDVEDLMGFSDDELEMVVLDLFALRRWRDLSATHPEVTHEA